MSDPKPKLNETTSIEERICSIIRSVPNQLEAGLGDTPWTEAVRKPLLELGESLGFDTCPSSCNCGWLYDLVWYENDASGQLKSVPLVLESEWGKQYHKIKYDFEKLLVAKATYKVMVFQACGDRMRDYFKRMKAGIQAFGGPKGNETYLLACFDERRWVFEIETERTSTPVEFGCPSV